MSESDHHSEPHISAQDLRKALSPRGESRRNPLMTHVLEEAPPGELAALRRELEASQADAAELRTAVDAARADAIELRAALDACRADAQDMREELDTARTEARSRRIALQRIASAGPFRRRRVLAELAEQGVL